MYKKILLAVDFSEITEKSAKTATTFSGSFGAKMHTCYVVKVEDIVPQFVYFYPQGYDYVEQIVKPLQIKFHEFSDNLGIKKSHQHFIEGNAKQEILRISENTGIDLIVLGGHSHSKIGMLGSVSSAVSNKAKCDVLIVNKVAPYKNILICTDYSEESIRSLAKAIEIAATFKAKVHVCHVIHPVASISVHGYYYPLDIELEKNALKNAEKKMKEISINFNIKPEQQHVFFDHPKQGIVSFAGEVKANLIIVAGHQHSFFGIIGSTANYVANKAGCDVLIVNNSKTKEIFS